MLQNMSISPFEFISQVTWKSLHFCTKRELQLILKTSVETHRFISQLKMANWMPLNSSWRSEPTWMLQTTMENGLSSKPSHTETTPDSSSTWKSLNVWSMVEPMSMLKTTIYNQLCIESLLMVIYLLFRNLSGNFALLPMQVNSFQWSVSP